MSIAAAESMLGIGCAPLPRFWPTMLPLTVKPLQFLLGLLICRIPGSDQACTGSSYICKAKLLHC